MIFAVSKEKLYLLDGNSETMSKINLPFVNPSAIDYVAENNRLYIGFKDGHLVYYDVASQEYRTVIGSGFDNIDDLEVDININKAFVIKHHKVEMVDLETLQEVTNSINLAADATLDVDRVNKKIVAGGDPSYSVGNVYSFNYDAVGIYNEGQDDIGGFIDKILLSPDGANMVLVSYHYNYGFSVYRVKDFSFVGRYDAFNASACCYSRDGSNFYIGRDFDEGMMVYNVSTFEKITSFNSYDNLNYITTTMDDTKLVQFSKEFGNNVTYLLFWPL